MQRDVTMPTKVLRADLIFKIFIVLVDSFKVA